MKKVKSFDEFIKNGIVKKVALDTNRLLNFVRKAERKYESIGERLNKLGITKKNAEEYVESSYDIVMLLIRAKMLSEGYKAIGYGAHEAEVSFLGKLDFSENEIQFADQLRYFRNGMLYYGTELDKEYAQKAIDFLNLVYPKLKKLVEK